MSRYTHFTKLKHLIFLNGGSIYLFLTKETVRQKPHSKFYELKPQKRRICTMLNTRTEDRGEKTVNQT
jgi:hypothetical protein